MNQKLENVLNLALETDEEVRERTETLNVGFSETARSWELIVKYHGNLGALAQLGVGVEYLIAGYAILTVPDNLVDTVSKLEQIEYVEKPKRYYYSVDMANGAQAGAADGFDSLVLPAGVGPAETGCFANVFFGGFNLTGEGVLIAVLDSGIDWKKQDFRNADGSTRIAYLWDQTLRDGSPPEGFNIGGEFTAEQINEALRLPDGQEQFLLLPSVDVSGHGTAVAGIAAGARPRAGYLGAAPKAEILAVKLGVPSTEGFPRTTEIMRAVTWALQKANEMQRPLAINLSFGNCYGAHDGSSLLERFLDNA